MSYLLKFLKRYHFLVLFVVLQVLSLVLLTRFNNYQASVFFTSANAVMGKVYQWADEVTGYFHLKETNTELTLRNAQLEVELAHLKELQDSQALDTAAHHRIYLSDTLTSYFTSVPARVINNAVSHANNFITIDKGSRAGVKEGMGVVSGNGVVGIVYLTGAHYAIVMPILNSKSSISCKVRRTDYFGSLHWDGASPEYAFIEDFPRHAEFSVGDTIVTSGHSQVFPEGMLVGTVHEKQTNREGLISAVRIHLGADFSRLKNLVVLTHPLHGEQKLLEDSIKKLITP